MTASNGQPELMFESIDPEIWLDDCWLNDSESIVEDDGNKIKDGDVLVENVGKTDGIEVKGRRCRMEVQGKMDKRWNTVGTLKFKKFEKTGGPLAFGHAAAPNKRQNQPAGHCARMREII